MIKGRVDAASRQRKQQREYVGMEAEPVIVIIATTAQFYKASLLASSITLELCQNVQLEKLFICIFGL